ncbi:MAG: hypothetical protein AAF430_24895 [Myxococcota bacterium]
MQRFGWLGVAVIGVWVATLLTSLSMMWDRTWMEGNPPSELATGGLHGLAVIAGLGLGGSLLARAVRRELSRAQTLSFAVAFGLSATSVALFLKP